MFTPDQLKSAAAAQNAQIRSRVRDVQGGVPTYFDALVLDILRRLELSESSHGWNTDPPESPDRDSTGTASLLQWLAAYLADRTQGRFVSYEDRVRRRDAGASDIRSPERAMSQGTAECLTWKGRPLFKNVYDFAILPMLLWELRPATVFEIGSGTGASARWLADIMASAGLDSQVYSVDIAPVAEPYPGVHFLAGDCNSPSTLFGAELLRCAPRPRLVIEDAHVNVYGVCAYIDQFLTEGDYLFIEDSLLKYDDIQKFLRERPDRYSIDTLYTDFFGRNATSAGDSILVRR